MARMLEWQLATVGAIRDETPSVRSFTLGLPEWAGHRAGQHVDLRLTAEDGYSVERSYSIASEPERMGQIDITVERIPDGEVSPFLHDVVVPGDRLEVRGPIGGYFVWDVSMAGPLLLVAGGSGVVPLMAMLRHRARGLAADARARAGGGAVAASPTRLLFSSRSADEIIYREELDELAAVHDGFEVVHTLTRQQPPGWSGYARRIDERMLAEVLDPLGSTTRAYICGPTALVETAANGLVALGFPPDRVRTERFGPTGT
jgi:ferredoxin-NADP reductase